ncbi:MAG TPA: metallophosphoesterase [Solirubrobacteraceae bacterium]|nr:metallophosphoesterase [Solirubrobacteraceae bacterium]
MTIAALAEEEAAEGDRAQLTSVRAVVLSDIHATVEPDSEQTHVAKASAELTEGNALTAARTRLKEEFNAADLVLCPGDMVHRGDPKPMEWVWEELQGIASDLGAVLIGAVGNHDLLREPSKGQEPTEELRLLKPKFPHADEDCRKGYWADAFGVLEGENWRVLSLNSCALHGGFDQSEAEFGRLKERSVLEMEEYFASCGARPAVNICMCHHHPQEWSHGGERETKHLLGGDLLINLLDSRPERWMLLHGHKHYPALGYFGHSTHGPVRLAAASVGINLMADTGVEVRNQMHVIDFDLGARETLGLPMAGEIRSFTWDGAGWHPADSGGLPGLAGFGYRRDGAELAHELRGRSEGLGRGVWTWEQIVAELDPRVPFLTPADRSALLEGIRDLGGGIADDEHGFLQVTLP